MTTDQQQTATMDPPATDNGDTPTKAPKKKPHAAAVRDDAPAAVRVTFTDMDEFAEEMVADAAQIQHAIVRLEGRELPKGNAYAERHLELLCGYVVRGQVVELQLETATFWGDVGNGGDEQAAALAQWMELLRTTCEAGGLEVRGGRFGAL